MEEHRRRKKIFWRLCVFGILMILPAVAITFVDFYHYKQIVIERAELESLRLAKVISTEEQKYFDAIKNVLISLTKYAEINKNSMDDCNQSLATLMDYFNSKEPIYLNLGVADINGDTICSALTPEERVNIADRYYFRSAIEKGEFSIGGYQVGRITKEQSINFGYPLKDDLGRIVFVSFVAVNLDWLNDKMSQIQFGGNSTVTITDNKNYILVRYPEGKEMAGQIWPEGKIANIHSEIMGTSEGRDMNEEEKIFGFIRVPETITNDYLYVMVGLPKEEVLERITAAKTRNFIIILASLIISLLSCWLVSKYSFRKVI